MQTLEGTVVENVIEGRLIRFFVKNRMDVIQAHHLHGMFYEREELEIIRKFWKPNGVFVDIGTNVGNHAIYVSKFLDADRIYVFEPNPEALEILRVNLALNNCANVDTSFLGYAVSDQVCTMRVQPDTPNNLGGAQMVADPGGTLSSVPGDQMLASRSPGFLKIDAEQMEMQVLGGLSATIRTWRPNIFIEVHQSHIGDMQAWCERSGYAVQTVLQRYPELFNYMMTPLH